MKKIKVLYGHNFYLQQGGEDTTFSVEVNLLRQNGHDVVEYTENNKSIEKMNLINFVFMTHWSWETYQKLINVIRKERPDIVHFQNTFPLISPSAYDACRDAGVPVVQALQNPRLMCPSANFYRDGKLCQDCLGKTPPWPGIIHGCYRKSRLQTLVVASFLTFHRIKKTWKKKVDFFIISTDFYRQKFIEGGLPADKLLVKPHFIHPDPGTRSEQSQGDYALFVNRLDPEKGVRTLLAAWKNLNDIPLKIIGSGQLENEIIQFRQDNDLSNAIELLGQLPRDEVMKKYKEARFLVWPSEGFYETFGYVAVESFSCGVPVIASRIGVLRDIVTDGVTGLHFNPGDPEDLAIKVRWAWEHPVEMAEMGRNARCEYEEKYTADKNYDMLMEIYQRAIQSK
jgi:glycosyltransferase involved in cell wall biosynthesis